MCCRCEGHSFVGSALHLLALLNRPLCLEVQPVHAFVIDAWEPRAQQVVDAALAEVATQLRDLANLGAELLYTFIDQR
jgi:hypothetical protein